MKSKNYFDGSKSIVENAYYLLMILSIVFVAIQVIIARNSMNHSTELELTSHTIEQDNHYRVAIESKAEEFIAALRDSRYDISDERIDSVMMQSVNLEETTPEEGFKAVMLLNDSVWADPVELERLVQIQIDLATELEQYAFFVLNGFLFEELAYRDIGNNTFLRAANLSAFPAIYMLAYRNYARYNITESRHVRRLYDIWWYRQQIDKRNNRIAILRSVLSDDKHEMAFLQAAGATELSLGPDELRATIVEMERELAELEKTLAEKLKNTAIRNI